MANSVLYIWFIWGLHRCHRDGLFNNDQHRVPWLRGGWLWDWAEGDLHQSWQDNLCWQPVCRGERPWFRERGWRAVSVDWKPEMQPAQAWASLCKYQPSWVQARDCFFLQNSCVRRGHRGMHWIQGTSLQRVPGANMLHGLHDKRLPKVAG